MIPTTCKITRLAGILAMLATTTAIGADFYISPTGSTVQVTKLDQKDTVIRYNWDHDTIKKGIRFDTTNDGTFGYDGTVHHNITFRDEAIR